MNNLSRYPELIIITIVLLIGCNKEDINVELIIPDGLYEGYYAYSGDTIWEAIIFKADTFKEVPSGGLQMGLQKFPCIVEGLYNIQNKNINFNVLEYPVTIPDTSCDSNIFLSGDYSIIISNKEITFWKGEGISRHTYKLKLQLASR